MRRLSVSENTANMNSVIRGVGSKATAVRLECPSQRLFLSSAWQMLVEVELHITPTLILGRRCV